MGHITEDYCTRAASLMAKLNHQRMQAQFCDCVIRKGLGQVYPVHRCILAASSPVLASILDSSGVLVELEAPCLSDCILGYLLDYIYTGTLPQLDYKLYSYLLAAAQYLEMDELQLTIRTKAADTHEYCNTTDEANRFTLLTPRIDCYKNPSESPLHYCSDCVYIKSKPDVTNSVSSETDQTSDITGRSDQKQQLSIVCQDKGKNQSSGAIKPETWHKNEQEEARSHLFVSTQEQENEPTQIEKTQGFCKHSNVKNEKIQSNSREGKNHNSSCSSTSVIRHISRVTRVPEGNVAIKLPHATEPCTGQIITERTYSDIAEDTKASYLQFINQDLEYTTAQDYRSCSVNLFGNNNLDNFEKDSNKNEQTPANVSDSSSHVQQAFQCSLCERSFSQRGSLNRHVRSHLGVRPFPCPQCPMSFSRQYRVVEHMRVHQRSVLGMDFPKPPASSV
ncbi:zinc finger and BTB domain-containing protein 43-like [Periophthalmus magnuspinnatus]|uniref:zinc finger and BTB domain-containing protein 43-like n=1 Tax=Periophthalmus magnuspinnatus TaxID=409849 RepID=UPI00243665B1|nr:zinc finger and BTB domain-containing protein 43-like [Periophthalmus magnuspinnatus]